MSDTSPTAVQTLSVPNWPETGAALAAAFVGDPVFCWMLPEPARRPAALRRYFAIEARHIALQHGCSVAVCDASDVVGVALVFPPDRWRMPVSTLARQAPGYLRIFGRRTPQAIGMLASVERRHLLRPHYYLGYIGVVPSAQGRGFGSALLKPIADRCDAEGLPGYLEASSPSSARLYERFGFASVEQIRPLGAPPIELMVREPR